MTFRIGVLMLAAAIFMAGGTDADPTRDPQALRKQLKQLEAEIDKFRDMLQQTRSDRAELETNLEQNEEEISEILQRMEKIRHALDEGEEKVSGLNREERSLEDARMGQQALIKKQVRAAYEIGRQEYLKVVLNQEDPDRIARMLTWYDYFNEARAEQVAAYRQTIDSLRQVRTEIAHENTRLRQNRKALNERRAALEEARAKRQENLIALNAEIRKAGAEIEVREQDRERLEALLERITAGVVNLPTPGDTTPFVERKGQLLFPVAGQVSNPFGSPKASGKLRWNGVFIKADAGEPVNAVHYGRVVFSDWLRGFGLLLIINHGQGYMSLYGHNEVLYRETGDWVTAGETIATVGNTGGQERSGLYFEIRHAGKPTNPQNWCRIRSKSDGQA
ncbi:MAG: peptidoglycan DD-metalloendopeptidase family protein [Gammaproteobacteria bacterium]|nr:peptidoglycan DD-metalloendopeptidase family protein [Gammaproteobacteria bacterium]